MADQPLAGRVAAVTGASSGIGEATATALSRAGATVALAARRRDRLEALAERLEGPSSVHEVDVTDEEQARSFVEAAHAEHGGLHGLVNNAGVMLLGAVERRRHLREWRRMLDVNLWGLLVCTHTALPLIAAERGRGHRERLVGGGPARRRRRRRLQHDQVRRARASRRRCARRRSTPACA